MKDAAIAPETESFLLVDTFKRSGTTTISEDDGRLWEMWPKLQRLKAEKEDWTGQ